MTHLQPDEIADAVDGTIRGAAALHLRQCDSCRGQVQELSSMLRAVEHVDVPEPSPLFWDHLSARVRGAIGADPMAVPVRRWFRPAVLVPLGALATIIMALAAALPDRSAEVAPARLLAENHDLTLDAAAVDTEPWEMVTALLADADFAAAAADLGLHHVAGAADEAAIHLNAAEQQELVRLLQAELHGSGG
jgi:hypothetical protein